MHYASSGNQITQLRKGNKIKNPPHCGGFLLACLDSPPERIHSGREPRQTEPKLFVAIKKPKQKCFSFLMLAYLDSNQDKQNQNLSYYHYTIGQSPFRGCKNKVMYKINQKIYQIDQLLSSRSFSSLILSSAPATTSHMIV